MSISCQCPQCGKQYTVALNLVGKTAKCSACQFRFVIIDGNAAGISAAEQLEPSFETWQSLESLDELGSSARAAYEQFPQPSALAPDWMPTNHPTDENAPVPASTSQYFSPRSSTSEPFERHAASGEAADVEAADVEAADLSPRHTLIVSVVLSVVLSAVFLGVSWHNPKPWGFGNDLNARLLGTVCGLLYMLPLPIWSYHTSRIVKQFMLDNSGRWIAGGRILYLFTCGLDHPHLRRSQLVVFGGFLYVAMIIGYSSFVRV